MENKIIIYSAIVLLIATLFALSFFYTQKEGVKYCDLKIVDSAYKGEQTCYEEPSADNFKNGRLIKPIALTPKS